MKTAEMTAIRDPFMPTGGQWRFVVQFLDETDASEARERLVRMFGQCKANACLIVPGTLQPRSRLYTHGEWRGVDAGFRVYLPVGWR